MPSHYILLKSKPVPSVTRCQCISRALGLSQTSWTTVFPDSDLGREEDKHGEHFGDEEKLGNNLLFLFSLFIVLYVVGVNRETPLAPQELRSANCHQVCM